MSSGFDPEIKKYFRKIIRSFTWGALWLLTMATAGIFFKLGFVRDGWDVENYIFYGLALISLIWLLRLFYNIWKPPTQTP